MMPAISLGPGAFRLFLALAVFVSHTSRFNIGRPAVAIFFILSGYWVTRLYVERAESVGVASYLLDRLLRVWPLTAITAIVIVALAAVFHNSNDGSLVSTLALLGLATRHGDVIGVAWSLDIEMQFYIALPVVLWLIACVDKQRRTMLAVGGGALLFAIGIMADRYGVMTVLLWWPAFAVGIWIFLGRVNAPGWAAAASAALFVALLATPWLRPLLIKGEEIWWADTATVVLCATLVPLVAWNLRQRSDAFDRHMGNLSFPFYLVHYPLVHAITAGGHSTLLYKGLALIVSLAVAIVVYLAIDRPLDRVRKLLTARANGWRILPTIPG